MPTSNKPYIPEDLSKAPEYHLAQNLASQLPEIDPDSPRGKYLDSLAAISAVQVFEEIPGIQKSIISLESINSFEVWDITPHRVLLPSDVEFLKQDNNRVEAIAKKLIWLGESISKLEKL